MAIAKPRSYAIYTVALIGFIFTLHIVIPTYSNSSFLSLFADENTLGLIYMTGAALSIFGFLIIPTVIRNLGNYTTIFALVCIEILIFYGLISSSDPIVLSILFIIQSASSVLIGYCLDLFLESYTNHHKIGTTRGIYMTAMNTAWVIGPLIGSILIGEGANYKNTFFASLSLLFPLLYLIYKNFRTFSDPNYNHPRILKLIRYFSDKNDLLKLFYLNMILQIFYSWMVVYSPIYLNKFIGFDWSQIGTIIVIMLIPFVIFEYPLGKMSDNRYGEKGIMLLGITIMGLSTIFLSLTTAKILLVWCLIFFVTRTGASMIEIMIETYLFKIIQVKDTEILSAFRVARPGSFFFSSGLMILGLQFFDYRSMFVVIGIVVLTALIPIATIKDLK